MSAPVVEARGVTRSFPMPAGPVVAVRDLTVSIAAGELVAICGPSGCGKSTLLHMLGCVDAPSQGQMLVDGVDVSTLGDAERSAIRLSKIGFVFQRFFLLPMLTAAENVELPQAEAGAPRADRRKRTMELLDYVGLAQRAHHRPSQLSGGEAQRVAIARALANRPRLLLADEPTGELDQATGQQIVGLFERVHADGTTVVVVTHDPAIAARSPRVLFMRDGRLENGAGGMILLIAVRSVLAHPIRSAMLACGFGLGVSVMATLLGVGEVILEQARSPALVGGGDVVVTSAAGRVESARFLLSSVLGVPPLRERVAAASPRGRAPLFLVRGERLVPIMATGGIPSRERALGDRETASVGAWVDAPGDAAWVGDPAAVLRAMDRFHPVPDVPARASSWAEWLYFNGGVEGARFYLTFMVGPPLASGRRSAGVRLQLERGGRTTSYGEGTEVEDAAVLASAPDLVIGRNEVRLDGLRYRIRLDLPRMDPPGARAASAIPERATGEIVLEAVPGRSLPPLAIRGTRGWISGYVVPVMSGTLVGTLAVGGQTVALGGRGYHDHNWGFWDGVTWQWGQVHHDALSFVYGRVHPPPDAADPERVPGFLAALGPDGPIGYAADVSITETNDPATGRPRSILVRGRGPSLNLSMELAVEDEVATRMAPGFIGGATDFLQLRARYRVAGRAGGRRFDFEAPGAAETFRGRGPLTAEAPEPRSSPRP